MPVSMLGTRTAEHNANLIERLESQLSHWPFSYSAGIHSIRTHLSNRIQNVISPAYMHTWVRSEDIAAGSG